MLAAVIDKNARPAMLELTHDAEGDDQGLDQLSARRCTACRAVVRANAPEERRVDDLEELGRQGDVLLDDGRQVLHRRIRPKPAP